MSVIAVAAIGVGAAAGAIAVTAGVAVATVMTVAAVVGVVGIGLTVVGAVTKNKLLGQIGMVMSMGALGAAGGAALASWAAAPAAAAGTTGAPLATGETVAASATAPTAGVAAPQAVSGAAVDFGTNAAANAVTEVAPGAGVLTGGQTLNAAGQVIAPAAAGPQNLGTATTIKTPGVEGVQAPTTKPPTPPASGWADFWNSNAGGAVMAGAPGAVMQGVGGMMQGAGASKAAEANYQMQQQQLALEKAKWERANAAAPIKFTHNSFDPTAPFNPTVG